MTDHSKLWNQFKSDRKPFVILYLYMLILYAPLIFLRLTNQYDGLWNEDDYMAGAWELSNGRWFWPYLDHARFGVSLDPLPGLAAMAGFVLAVLIIGHILQLRWKLRDYLAAMLFLASTGITCQLSFSYMSITFAFSTVMAVLAVYVIIGPADQGDIRNGHTDRGVIREGLEDQVGIRNGLADQPAISEGEPGDGACAKEAAHFKDRLCTSKNLLRVVISGCVIAVMMGCYQASLGITCLCALGYFMQQLTRGTGESKVCDVPNGSKKNCGQSVEWNTAWTVSAAKRNRVSALYFALNMFLALVLGGVLYIAGLKLHEWIFNVEPADYQGFADLTAGYLLQHLPEGIAHAYYTFRGMFLDGTFLVFFGQTGKGIRFLYLLPAALLLLLIGKAWMRSYANGILMAVSAAIIPVFANAFYLLAPESECHMQMIVPMTLVIPMIFWISWNAAAGDDGKETSGIRSRILAGICMAGCGLLLWTGAAMTVTDEYAMYVGRRATQEVAQGILNSMNAQSYDYLKGSVLILGNPCESQIFQTTELYQKANTYAQYGNWTDETGLNNQIWEEFFTNYLRINVSFVTADTRETICSLPEVTNMPVYPAAGSVQNIYGVEVIKLAEDL